VLSARIDPEKIGLVIGPAGKNIKALSEKYDVQINVEEDGSLTVYGKDRKSTFDARDAILGMVEEPEVGKIYQGTVKRIMDLVPSSRFFPEEKACATSHGLRRGEWKRCPTCLKKVTRSRSN